MTAAELVSLTPEGLFCPAGHFHIDPVRPVARALITHAHSDHARPGHGAVLATQQTLDIMRLRLGETFATTRETAGYGRSRRIGDVDVSFHPAGHVLGSAQICIERGGRRLVISGDYKRAADPTCLPFEPLRCEAFITEATFGLPVFRHPDAADEIARLLASLRLFSERTHLVGAYSLGKAQRLIALLRLAGYDRPIYLHGAMEKLTEYYVSQGAALGDLRKAQAGKGERLPGEIVLCPPNALNDLWSRRFAEPVNAFASGWMRTRARARQRGVELPLVVSDHADWEELCTTIQETGCEQLLVTHGQEDALVHWARSIGLDARPLSLHGYGDEDDAAA